MAREVANEATGDGQSGESGAQAAADLQVQDALETSEEKHGVLGTAAPREASEFAETAGKDGQPKGLVRRVTRGITAT